MKTSTVLKILLISITLIIALPLAHAFQGEKQWTTILASTAIDWSNTLTSDSSGNIYTSGYTSNGNNFGGSPNNTYGSSGNEDAFVTKLDSDGVKQWTTILASTTDDGAYLLTIDDNGNVFLTGSTQNGASFGGSPNNTYGSTGGYYDVFVTKLDSNGIKQWTTILGSTGSGYEIGTSLTIDDVGNIFLTGHTSKANSFGGAPNNTFGSVNGEDVYVTKLNSDGVKQWTTILASTGLNDGGDSLTIDDAGNLYLSGFTWNGASFGGSPNNTYGSFGRSDVFVTKLDSNGIKQWTTIIASTADENGRSLVLDDAGNVYVGGITSNGNNFGGSPNNTYGSSGNEDAFVTKLDSDGVKQWTTIIASTANDGGDTLILDGSGNIFLSGTAGDGVNFGASPNYTYGTTGSEDAFVTKLDSDGVKQWTTIIASSSSDFGLQSIIDGSGNIFLTGAAGNGASFGGSPDSTFGSTGGEDAFVTKLSGVGSQVVFQVDGMFPGARQNNKVHIQIPGDLSGEGWDSVLVKMPFETAGVGMDCNRLYELLEDLQVNGVWSGGYCVYDINPWLRLQYGQRVDEDGTLSAGALVSIDAEVEINSNSVRNAAYTYVFNVPNAVPPVVVTDNAPVSYIVTITGLNAGDSVSGVWKKSGPTMVDAGLGPFFAGDSIYISDDKGIGSNNFIRFNFNTDMAASGTWDLSSFIVNTEGSLVMDNCANPTAPGCGDNSGLPGDQSGGMFFGMTKDILIFKSLASMVGKYCPGTDVYSGDGILDIVDEWNTKSLTCDDSITQNDVDSLAIDQDSNIGQWLVFLGAQGSGGIGFSETNLTINDSAEGSSVATGISVDFFAYYFNATSGAPLTGNNENCSITHDASGSNVTYYMEYDAGNGRWNITYADGYSSTGGHYWNVTCNTTATGHFNLTAADDITITEAAVPEFSDIAWVLAAVLGAGGFFLIRRQKSF